MSKEKNLKEQVVCVIDVATTGFRPHIDEPVEIAIVKKVHGKILDKKVWRFKPSVSIPPTASAVHEIRDSDVAGCKPMSSFENDIKAFVGSSPLVMHNLSIGEPLDKSMVPCLADNVWLCSARLAKHTWPQMTLNEKGFPLANYDVWALAYWSKKGSVDRGDAQVFEPLAQALAASVVFDEALDVYMKNDPDATIDGLREWAERPVEMVLWPRGEHKNVRVSELPEDVLSRAMRELREDQDFDKDLGFTVEQEMARRLKAQYGYGGGVRKFASLS
jgi:DNA polymerase III epsilon subunit-like protein